MSTTADTPAPALGFLLHDVARLLRKRFEQNGRGFGLTRAQWQVLAVLQKADGIQQSGLAELLEIEPITLARLLDRLEVARLVERRPHPSDRRIKLIYLLPDALPVIAQMRETGELTRAEALVDISEADSERLAAILTVMRRNLVKACNPGYREKAASRS
jgi:DNA-binding MarR family transcriptional regulator